MKYTTFCRESSGLGTTHITCVEADTPEAAMKKGLIECLEDWCYPNGENYHEGDVVCIGVAEGDVKILYWEDLSE